MDKDLLGNTEELDADQLALLDDQLAKFLQDTLAELDEDVSHSGAGDEYKLVDDPDMPDTNAGDTERPTPQEDERASLLGPPPSMASIDDDDDFTPMPIPAAAPPIPPPPAPTPVAEEPPARREITPPPVPRRRMEEQQQQAEPAPPIPEMPSGDVHIPFTLDEEDSVLFKVEEVLRAAPAPQAAKTEETETRKDKKAKKVKKPKKKKRKMSKKKSQICCCSLAFINMWGSGNRGLLHKGHFVGYTRRRTYRRR
jgi:hypothetical protein